MKIFMEPGLVSNLISTAVLFISLLGIRFLVLRTIRGWDLPSSELRRRWIVQIRNATVLLFLLGVFLIWATELKEFAVSIVAFAVALVVATKELLLCAMGGSLKYSGSLFRVGDRVEIADIRGDVIGHNFLVTTIYEIGPGRELHQFTGRVVVVPNSLFLSNPVFNETQTGQYSLHVFRIPFSRQAAWKLEARKLLEAANAVCADYLSEARDEFMNLARKEGLESTKVEPRIQISYPDKDRIDLVVRMPVPARAKGRIEQAVLMKFSEFEN